MDEACVFCERIQRHATAPDPDTICEFRNSIAYLGRWQFYQGYTVLVAKVHATELDQLTDRVRHEFLDEMCTVARVIGLEFQPSKLNYELLGNQVPHLHWHIFPRYANDEHVHLPVWLDTAAAERDPSLALRFEQGRVSRSTTIQLLRTALVKWAIHTD